MPLGASLRSPEASTRQGKTYVLVESLLRPAQSPRCSGARCHFRVDLDCARERGGAQLTLAALRALKVRALVDQDDDAALS